MKMFKRIHVITSKFAIVAFAALSAPAFACTLSVTALQFGSINPLDGSSTDSTATVTVSGCDSTVLSVTIAMSTSASGATDPREMSSGLNTLQYQIYQDSAMQQVWGDGTFGSVWSGTPVGGSVTLTAYGRVPSQPRAAVGSYSDSITVTATF